MENLESLLREEFSQEPEQSPVLVSDLIANTRRIRRRRTTVSAASAFVVVLAVAALVTGLVNVSGKKAIEPAGPPMPTPSVIGTVAVDRILQKIMVTGIPDHGLITSDGHGVIAVNRCSAGATGPCSKELAVTANGATFTRVNTPPGVGDDATFFFFDQQRFVIDEPMIADGDPPIPTRWVSTNGGARWSTVDATPGPTVSRIPDGDFIIDMLPSTIDTLRSPAKKSNAAFGVIGPDGDVHKLTGTPPSAMGVLNGGASVGGTYFLDADSGGAFVSADRGATWKRVLRDQSNDQAAQVKVAGIDEGCIYATIEALAGNTLERSTDRGLTWTKVAWPAPSAFEAPTPDPNRSGVVDPSTLGQSAAVLPGVGLFVTTGAQLWLMPSGTDKFQLNDSASPLIIYPAAAAVIGIDPDPDHPAVILTMDGSHWTPVKMPQ